jgi:hypothetical protein
MSLFEEYSQRLSELSGIEFQDEVCARLYHSILGFQTVPSKPQGDAGLDGFSHGGKRGYCCYGLENIPSATNKQRESAIVKKFKSDLRRLFELEHKNKKLVHAQSPEMSKILPKGTKLEYIELIANWFDSHRVLSPILTAVGEYKLASKCNYVEPTADVIVVGPKELANRYGVDEITIARIRQRAFIKTVKEAAQVVTIDNPKDFEFKMTVLRKINPDKITVIQTLADLLLANWRMAIAFEKKLDETAPSLHRTLEENRPRILTKVMALMLGQDEPWTQLLRAEELAEEILKGSLGNQFGELIQDVSFGEIARLIGECPISWKEPVN